MTNAPIRVEGLHDSIEISVNGSVTSFTWSYNNGGKQHELVRFDAQSHLLSIVPHASLQSGFGEQYSQIREIQFDTSVLSWSPESPISENDGGQLQLDGLPKGFGRVFEYGLGIQRPYRGLIHAVEDKSDCSVVRFGAQHDEGAIGNVFHISIHRFNAFKHSIDLHVGRGATVVGRIKSALAHNELAEITGDQKVQPVLGRLGQIQAMTRAISDDTPLDADERDALASRFQSEAKQIATEQPQTMGKLREDLELVTLDVLIENFRRAITGKNAKIEATWQKFFKDNTFALKQIFASPVVYFGEQLRVRSADAYGAGGQIVDFLLINAVTRSALLVEIKTPVASLIAKQKYRGTSSAEVYAPHKDLSGAIAQLQAQIQSAHADIRDILRRTPGVGEVDTNSVTGAVVAGTLDSLNQGQRDSFVRYRSGLHGVVVLTFDEILERLIDLREMLQAREEDGLANSVE
ncbi:Shedu immune nuclease family protein [Arthrobacter sp. TMN-50]